jgi:hypothetical protein
MMKLQVAANWYQQRVVMPTWHKLSTKLKDGDLVTFWLCSPFTDFKIVEVTEQYSSSNLGLLSLLLGLEEKLVPPLFSYSKDNTSKFYTNMRGE